MSALIHVINDRCVNCGACLRVCPSPEANIRKTLDDGRIVMSIDDDKCLACGKCIKACGSGARNFDDDTDRFFNDLKERKIVLVVHPAMKSAFKGNWQAVLKWFKQNGVAGVYDGANGADICTWAYARAYENGSVKSVISQHCPAVVGYIMKYHPDDINDVSPIYPPLSCEVIYIRDYLKINYAVAALTPCPAMKKEFEDNGHIEYNITFKSLKEYFRRKKVDFSRSTSEDLHYDFDDSVQGLMGAVYSDVGGMCRSITQNMPDIVAVSADGLSAYDEIEEFYDTPSYRHPQVYEMLSCDGGCGMGCGCTDKNDDITLMDVRRVWREAEIDVKKRRKVNLNGSDKMFKRFDDILNPRSFLRTYTSDSKVSPKPSEKELSAVFASFGKTTGPDKNINCGACGRNCRKLAEAIYAGRAVSTDCILYAKSVGGSQGGSANNEKAVEIASHVSEFAKSLIAEMDNMGKSLSAMNETSKHSSGMAGMVENILEQIVGFCSASTSIEADNLDMLVSTLDKLKAAVSSLHGNVDKTTSDSAEINESISAVSGAAEELNQMAQAMANALGVS
ncbi:MAG: 4Fe-4S dicluster domain-containing protein [Oscillospiraceae bacterium]|nr:4Fe-4S dicluster domain-containing protein [Oscillospiraceae bacterium]